VDFNTLNAIVSWLSGAMMMASIIYTITFILGSFSSKSGAQSLKTVLLSLLYFFGSAIPLFMGVNWLMQIAIERLQGTQSFYLNVGASTFALAALLNIFCGILTVGLYVKGLRSQGLTLQQAIADIRVRIRSKPKK